MPVLGFFGRYFVGLSFVFVTKLEYLFKAVKMDQLNLRDALTETTYTTSCPVLTDISLFFIILRKRYGRQARLMAHIGYVFKVKSTIIKQRISHYLVRMALLR